MDSERLNLSALDPSLDTRDWEALIDSIVENARPELNRRAAAQSPLYLLATWARPMLATAALLAIISIAALRTMGRDSDLAPYYAPDIDQEAGVPAPLANWLTEERDRKSTRLNSS